MEISKKEEEQKQLKPHSLLYSFTVIVILLVLISLINLTVRSIFSSEQQEREIKVQNLLFDPDKTRNWTSVCPILKDEHTFAHKLKWKLSSCYNKTLLHWHIPWIRTWIWSRFNDFTEERKRLKRLEEEKAAEALKKKKEEEAAAEDVKIEAAENKLVKEFSNESAARNTETKKESSGVVYTALSAMVLLSAIVACVEFFHDKYGKKSTEEVSAQEQRRCSLADFTMNKHLRKESHETLQRQSAFDEPKKVNNLLLHQGSLDRAMTRISPGVTRLPRQSSVPLSMTAGCSSTDQKPGLQAVRKLSIDTSEEERSPGMKRRSRHFIRRH